MPIRKLISEQDRIADAANLAVVTISTAAAEATKVVASAAASAAQLVETRGSLDHDLLIELKTRLEALKNDIKDLKDGTSTQINDHENRLNTLESAKSKQAIMITVIIALGFIATTLLVYHMFGVKIG
jgi:pyruvate-formate lyase-activating enzyme